MKRLGLMGGTYDPPHFGHLAAAEEARCRLKLDKVLWIPAGDPPHKAGRGVTDAHHRLAMVELAIRDNPCFEICDAELHYSGPSYTVRTLERLRLVYPEDALVFLMGSDEFNSLSSWYHARDIPRLAQLGVLVRSGTPVYPQRVEHEIAEVRGRYQLVTVPDLPLSSSNLRERVRLGLPVRYLTPDSVVEYIGCEGLYLS